MLTLSLIIALILDRTFDDLQGYRSFRWLGAYWRWLVEHLKIDQLGFWFATGILLLSILILVGLIGGLFHNALFGLFELAFYVVIACLCLGPRSLDRDIDVYIDGLGADDPGQNARAAELFGVSDNAGSRESVRQVGGRIFVIANRSLFTVIFWMTLAGPMAAVAYRLLERLTVQNEFIKRLDEGGRVVRLMAWMEWIPALLSSYAFMICGSFDAGLNRNQEIPMFGQNIAAVNEQRLHQVGLACSGVDTENEQLNSMSMIKKVRGLVLRSLVAWLAFGGLVEFWI